MLIIKNSDGFETHRYFWLQYFLNYVISTPSQTPSSPRRDALVS